ncbi:hypothetical protein [Nitratidesulfovibrio sp. SRB-5]|uniref:hypothetical protein n=1 Tax=Nitratidesulfovibrio sp. SRB-5 TaxID=2872636 RepID=UPI001026A306|nr:hypothetical protein [Nitratidesulfovibrio sp. SRB-5]MBZ2173427.1 hypothetical protein [Nitratidesulfovibrio sp. SRB-5]RXF77188.1 hypothetical protein EKK70_08070 [Desulfovibrio sp. DS-1]
MEEKEVKADILPDGRTIEFIRREYAARRIYLDNKDNYDSVEAAITALRAGGAYLASLGGALAGDPVACELELLNMIEDGRFAAMSADQLAAFVEGCGEGGGIVANVMAAHGYSSKYGYVLSDVGMRDAGVPRRSLLLRAIYMKDEKWKSILEEIHAGIDIPYKAKILFGFKMREVRFYGGNGLPWDRVKRACCFNDTYYEDLLDKFPDYTCSVSGIGSIDFSFEAAIARITIDICVERMKYLICRKLKISDDLYRVIVEELGARRDDFFRYSFEKISEHIESINENSYADILEIEKNDDALVALLAKENPSAYERIKECNAKLTSEMEKLKKRVSDSEKKLLSGRYRRSINEAPRFAGLYLWDLVEVEGMRFNAAEERFCNEYRAVLGRNYTENKSNPHHRLYSVTDACIREQVLLPMNSSSCFYDRRDMGVVKREASGRRS